MEPPVEHNFFREKKKTWRLEFLYLLICCRRAGAVLRVGCGGSGDDGRSVSLDLQLGVVNLLYTRSNQTAMLPSVNFANCVLNVEN